MPFTPTVLRLSLGIGMAGVLLVGWSVSECLLLGGALLTIATQGHRSIPMTISMIRGDVPIWEYEEAATVVDRLGNSTLFVGVLLSLVGYISMATTAETTSVFTWASSFLPALTAGVVKHTFCTKLSRHLRRHYSQWVDGIAEVCQRPTMDRRYHSERVA